MTAEAFRVLRLSLGLSQRQLAAKLGITSKEIISRLEHRKPDQPIPPKRAQALLDLAGLEACPMCGHPIIPPRGAHVS